MSEGGYRILFRYSRKNPGTCEEVNCLYHESVCKETRESMAMVFTSGLITRCIVRTRSPSSSLAAMVETSQSTGTSITLRKGPFNRCCRRYISLSQTIFFFRFPSRIMRLSFTSILIRSFGIPGTSQINTY